MAPDLTDPRLRGYGYLEFAWWRMVILGEPSLMTTTRGIYCVEITQ
jgi:hypothetical protein